MLITPHVTAQLGDTVTTAILLTAADKKSVNDYTSLTSCFNLHSLVSCLGGDWATAL